ncbi:MAG: hypothetical protein DWI58_12055 [Chloroflexi bacterium]|nr:MAG: hypothetical protein DWI58_12055 [Chloroflexota bacterium]
MSPATAGNAGTTVKTQVYRFGVDVRVQVLVAEGGGGAVGGVYVTEAQPCTGGDAAVIQTF